MPHCARQRKAKLILLKARGIEKRRRLNRMPERASHYFLGAAFRQRRQHIKERLDWLTQAQDDQMKAFLAPDQGPANACLLAPWWAFVSASASASGPRRSRNAHGRPRALSDPLVMALAPEGLAPDWDAIGQRVDELLAEPPFAGVAEQGAFARAWCGGRVSNFRARSRRPVSSKSKAPFHFLGTRPLAMGAFDVRRAKRRQDQPVPRAWSDTFGSRAPIFWNAGLAPRLREFPLSFPLVQLVEALIQALLEAGATHAFLCSDFGPLATRLLPERERFEATDAQILDQPRARWALEQAAPPIAKSRRRSL
jgi:hypothetical protein